MMEHLPRTLSGVELQRVLQTVPVRNRSQLPSPYDIVITHCNEPSLDWLLTLPQTYRKIYFYYKGNKPCPVKVPDVARMEWIETDNVGREGHTIVHHCLRCLEGGDLYEKMQPNDVVVFAQTFDPRHIEMCVQLHPKQWESYVFGRDYVANHIFPTDRNFALPEYHAKRMEPYSPLSFRGFYEKMFLRPMPSNTMNGFGNCFSTRVNRIRRHSRSMYERLLSELSAGRNPLVGHYFERCTYSIFGAADNEFPAVVS